MFLGKLSNNLVNFITDTLVLLVQVNFFAAHHSVTLGCVFLHFTKPFLSIPHQYF